MSRKALSSFSEELTDFNFILSTVSLLAIAFEDSFIEFSFLAVVLVVVFLAASFFVVNFEVVFLAASFFVVNFEAVFFMVSFFVAAFDLDLVSFLATTSFSEIFFAIW